MVTTTSPSGSPASSQPPNTFGIVPPFMVTFTLPFTLGVNELLPLAPPKTEPKIVPLLTVTLTSYELAVEDTSPSLTVPKALPP